MDKYLKRVIWAGILGNALELYDYTLYGYFASILALQFFSASDPVVALLATYGVYASGFLFRPIGAILIGSVGDKYGRKRALEVSILMMAVPTLCIGFLPSYATIGIAAPIILTLIRFIQGMSVGGELAGSFTYLVEHADSNQKGYIGSWTVVGGFGGKLIGTFIAGLLSLTMTPTLLENWGWRIPFILGFFFAGAGYWLRKKVSETPIFEQMKSQATLVKSPWKETFTKAPIEILQGAGIQAVHASFVHTLFIYFPIFLKTELNFSYTEAMFTTFTSMAICAALMPLSGKISDRIGRQPVLLTGTLLLTLFAFPAFWLFSLGDFMLTVATHCLLSALFGLMHGSYPALLNELFPANIRYTASAISYNCGVLLFGGLAPFMATGLIYWLETPIAPVCWLVFCGMISLTTLIWTKETHQYIRQVALET